MQWFAFIRNVLCVLKQKIPIKRKEYFDQMKNGLRETHSFN